MKSIQIIFKISESTIRKLFASGQVFDRKNNFKKIKNPSWYSRQKCKIILFDTSNFSTVHQKQIIF